MKPVSRFKKQICRGCNGTGTGVRGLCEECNGAGITLSPRTYYDWFQREASAEDIVSFVMQRCTADAMAVYCDNFNGDCVACKTSWVNSAIK